MSQDSAATLQMLDDIPTIGPVHIPQRYGTLVALCGHPLGGVHLRIPEDEVTDAAMCGTCEYHDIELRKQGL